MLSKERHQTATGPVLTAAEIPVASPGECFEFEELARRHGDFAIVGLAVRAQMEGAVFAALDLCFFGASPRPVLAKNAAKVIVGQKCNDEMVHAAIDALDGDLDPQEDTQADAAMRLHLAGVLLKRRLAAIVGKEAHQ